MAAKTYPVKIITNASLKEIYDLYGRAKIFWSASGYGVDEEKNPLGVEHFGMTVVEAMAGGCIPLVYKAGGQKESVSNGENGYLWESPKELVAKTNNLVQDLKLLKRISTIAKQDSLKFSYEHFEKEFLSLL